MKYYVLGGLIFIVLFILLGYEFRPPIANPWLFPPIRSEM